MKFDWVLFTDDLDTSIQELNQQEVLTPLVTWSHST